MNDPTARIFGGDERDSWTHNPYYNPENCDLTHIARLEDPASCYSFDTTIFVKDNPTGGIYAAQDSGCSCPTPFESVCGLPDMTLVRSIPEAAQIIARSYATYDQADVRKALDALREAGLS